MPNANCLRIDQEILKFEKNSLMVSYDHSKENKKGWLTDMYLNHGASLKLKLKCDAGNNFHLDSRDRFREADLVLS